MPLLTSGVGNGHYFKQVTVGIFEIKATSSAARVEPPVRVAERPAAKGKSLALHAIEDRIDLLIADMKRIAMAFALPGIDTRVVLGLPSP